MRAHVIDETGKIVNTIEVQRLGPGMVEASIGGGIGDTVVSGAVVKQQPKFEVPRIVSGRQARKALIMAGYWAVLQEAIAKLPEPDRSLAHEDLQAGEYDRQHPALVGMATQILGLSSAQLDELFIAAAAIK